MLPPTPLTSAPLFSRPYIWAKSVRRHSRRDLQQKLEHKKKKTGMDQFVRPCCINGLGDNLPREKRDLVLSNAPEQKATSSSLAKPNQHFDSSFSSLCLKKFSLFFCSHTIGHWWLLEDVGLCCCVCISRPGRDVAKPFREQNCTRDEMNKRFVGLRMLCQRFPSPLAGAGMRGMKDEASKRGSVPLEGKEEWKDGGLVSWGLMLSAEERKKKTRADSFFHILLITEIDFGGFLLRFDSTEQSIVLDCVNEPNWTNFGLFFTFSWFSFNLLSTSGLWVLLPGFYSLLKNILVCVFFIHRALLGFNPSYLTRS